MLRASSLGRQPRASAAARTRLRTCSLTAPYSPSARAAVAFETPASRATSLTVTERSGLCWLIARPLGSAPGPGCSSRPAVKTDEKVCKYLLRPVSLRCSLRPVSPYRVPAPPPPAPPPDWTPREAPHPPRRGRARRCRTRRPPLRLRLGLRVRRV